MGGGEGGGGGDLDLWKKMMGENHPSSLMNKGLKERINGGMLRVSKEKSRNCCQIILSKHKRETNNLAVKLSL